MEKLPSKINIKKGHCHHCHNKILTMCYKGLKHCSELCRQILEGNRHFNTDMN